MERAVGSDGNPSTSLDRAKFLRLAGAAVGAATLFAACGGGEESGGGGDSTAAGAASERPPIEDEPGNLNVFDWAGYDVPDLWMPYKREFPDKPPQFTFLENDDQALGKARAGFRADIVHPTIGFHVDWKRLGPVQPWDVSLLSNFESLEPDMVEAGKIDGKQYFLPCNWGFDSVLYRSDKVKPREQSWNLLYDERYSGKISWIDSPPQNVVSNAYVQGFADPWNLTDDELEKVRDDLIEKRKVVRRYWGTQTDMEADFLAGNIWIAYSFMGSYAAAKKKGLEVVYMHPKEGGLAWVDGLMLFADTKNYYHAHKYADAWTSPETGKWVANNYSYGTANRKADLSGLDPVYAELLDYAALKESRANLFRYIPKRKEYAATWEAVKAA